MKYVAFGFILIVGTMSVTLNGAEMALRHEQTLTYSDLRNVWVDSDVLNELTRERTALIDWSAVVRLYPQLDDGAGKQVYSSVVPGGSKLLQQISVVLDRLGMVRGGRHEAIDTKNITIRVIEHDTVKTMRFIELLRKRSTENIRPESIILILPWGED